ncbi:MAG: ABC transporter permease [Tetrasphaera sp.]|jgi:oligopeptide transport system permease protein|nr:ABC transporter permease [Tetrasphaera sp.]
MTDQTGVIVAEGTTGPEAAETVGQAQSLTQEAWRELRRNPLFVISLILITVFIVMAIFPSLFTNADPNKAILKLSNSAPSKDAWFGRDLQGYDVLARTVYGARASIIVGIMTTLVTGFLGVLIGTIAAYYGGILDTLVMRLTDIFFAIPFLLGGILFMSTFPNDVNSSYWSVVGKVVLALSILGWPSIARLMRGAVLQVKPNDYVQAARALGASPWRIIRSHILPNAMAPVMVVSMINLGAYIAAEASLSFLGIGLVPPAISWGVAISDSLNLIRTAPWILIFPSIFLSLAVLAFIMLGDAVRDAFDPKGR